MDIQRNQLRLLNVVVRKGLDQASLALLRMTGPGSPNGGIELERPVLRFIPIAAVPGITGNIEEPVVACYVGIDGDLQGHAMLLMSTASARLFTDMMLAQPLGTTQELDDMALSALTEAGNVCVSGFLNGLADDLKCRILPTPPQIVTDMAGAILETVAAHLIVTSEEVLLIETGFVGEANVPGHFLLLLDRDSRNRLIAGLDPQ